MTKIFASVLLVCSCFTAQAGEVDKQSTEIEQFARRRADQVERELHRGSQLPEWSGKYFYGDGTGENVDLSLAPQSGFYFQWNGCLGVYDRNYGKVEAVSGTIRLQCELPNKPGEGFEGTPTEFVPLRWGERHYLIATAQLIDFCNAVNGGEEPRKESWGTFLLREDDWDKPVTGAPPLPDSYAKFLLAKPIVTHIARVQPPTSMGPTGKPSTHWRTTRASVNVGTSAGLFLGMKFHVVEPDVVESAKVAAVREQCAELDFVQYINDGAEEDLPRPGWKLSTRPSYR